MIASLPLKKLYSNEKLRCSLKKEPDHSMIQALKIDIIETKMRKQQPARIAKLI